MANSTTWGTGGLFGYRSFFSLCLIVLCPWFVLSIYYAVHELDGSLLNILTAIYKSEFPSFFSPHLAFNFNVKAGKLISGYALFELALMRFVPGKTFVSTVTATGHIPQYKANGVLCYIITIFTLITLAYLDVFRPSVVYTEMLSLLATMNAVAFVFCLFLTIKGLYFPSTKDSGTTGDIIVDFFWGTELYPRVFGWDVKQFTNCRFGMMFWQVGIICYAYAQYEIYGYVSSSMLISVILQSIYIFKFFLWETGYFCSMDIQHDRAGYYVCWGCLVWVPSIYTMHTYFLVKHPVSLSLPWTIFNVALGALLIWVNYDCDRCDTKP